MLHGAQLYKIAVMAQVITRARKLWSTENDKEDLRGRVSFAEGDFFRSGGTLHSPIQCACLRLFVCQ